IIDFRGKILDHLEIPQPMVQVRMHPAGDRLALYGNSPMGQFLTAYVLNEKQQTYRLERKWSYTVAHYSDFPSELSTLGEWIVSGFEAASGPNRFQRVSHILGL